MPTIRSAEHLRRAVQFAAESRCHLIVVCTDQRPDGLSAVLDVLEPGQATVLTVRSGTKHHLLNLGTSLPQSGIAPAAVDISSKHNLGVLIGRVCGWTRVLFLDSDMDISDRADPMTETEYWREATKPDFWKHILEERAILLQDITERLTKNSNTTPLPSLEAAKQRLAELQPAEFVSFMKRWLITLAEWRDRLSVLSRVDLVDKAQAIQKALAELGMSHVVGGDEQSSPQVPGKGSPLDGRICASLGLSGRN